MEDVRRRGDRVGAQEEGQPALGGGGDEPPRRGRVPGDVHVLPRLQHGRTDLVGRFEELGRLAEVEAGLEGAEVCLFDHGIGREALFDPLLGTLGRAGVEPADQPEGEEVLGPFGVTGLDAGLLAHLGGDRGHGNLIDGVGGERTVAEGAGRVPGLGQVPFVERIDVDDEGGTGRKRGCVGLQGSRVHGHQHIGVVARSQDVVIGDVDLEGRYTGQGPRRCADLGGEVGERGQVVAEQGRGCGEPVTGQLHAVAGVAGEANDDAVEYLRRWLIDRGVGHPCSSGCLMRTVAGMKLGAVGAWIFPVHDSVFPRFHAHCSTLPPPRFWSGDGPRTSRGAWGNTGAPPARHRWPGAGRPLRIGPGGWVPAQAMVTDLSRYTS